MRTFQLPTKQLRDTRSKGDIALSARWGCCSLQIFAVAAERLYFSCFLPPRQTTYRDNSPSSASVLSACRVACNCSLDYQCNRKRFGDGERRTCGIEGLSMPQNDHVLVIADKGVIPRTKVPLIRHVTMTHMRGCRLRRFIARRDQQRPEERSHNCNRLLHV